MLSEKFEHTPARSFMPKTILIVEDNELSMRLFSDLLQANGYDTIQSFDGSDAIELAKKKQPNLIIMDIQLPEISGIEITNLIKSDPRLAHIPIIAVTAFASKGNKESIMKSGFSAYITKPVSIPNFLECVANFTA